jgi:thiamine biosynthesis protein ThiI
MRTEEFCALFSEKPRTRVSIEELNNETNKLRPSLIDDILSTMITLRTSAIGKVLDTLMQEVNDVDISEVPRNAVIIDLRSKAEYEAWHFPGAINASPEDLPKIVEHMGRDKTYVLYCKKGLSSRWGALELRRLGVKAFSISIERLRRDEDIKRA